MKKKSSNFDRTMLARSGFTMQVSHLVSGSTCTSQRLCRLVDNSLPGLRGVKKKKKWRKKKMFRGRVHGLEFRIQRIVVFGLELVCLV